MVLYVDSFIFLTGSHRHFFNSFPNVHRCNRINNSKIISNFLIQKDGGLNLSGLSTMVGRISLHNF